jgi:membrane-bound lytic murein transglycosylase A
MLKPWRAAGCSLLTFLSACNPQPLEPERLHLSPVAFDSLPGWQQDSQGMALAAFLLSCERIERRPERSPMGESAVGGLVADWSEPCAAASDVTRGDDRAARAFFERYFSPFRVSDGLSGEGLFTGYYEPHLSGATQPSERYAVPIYGRPIDLISVDLGAFRSGLSGRHIAGRVDGAALQPYFDRAEIEAGAISDRAPVIVWVDDRIDAFFLHVQGSGRIGLVGGGELRVGYAAGNGHVYQSIGRVLVDRGELKPDDVTLQSIRAWLAAHPDETHEVMAQNRSFIFFRKLEGSGPIGAQGAILTPGRSLAVDRAHLPLGAPVWLDILAPTADSPDMGRPLRRLVVAQDIGSAITGPLRGDLFWGFGTEAETIAGRMKHPGRLYLLLPRGAVKRRATAAAP